MENLFFDNTTIEIHREIQTGNIRHVVFDFDGTISLIRDGWQNVMVPMMVEFLQTETDTTETPEQLEALVVEFVDRLTGKQTIYQMMQLGEEIAKRGGTPREPLAYKDAYNRRLLPVVEERIAGLAAGKLSAEPLRVPMSLEFLQSLREMGINCYLASGTDVEFVKNEAEFLGVASSFDGGIFGALREYKKFSKAMVIQKILTDFSLSGDELLIIGDGYVEIENAKAVGAIAVGVASVEDNRYNMNADKRERLIRAGADIIIPDFREGTQLLSYLFNP
ncbi:HAD family hydrolase [Candidatus Poribacteria bacterium]|nr:HAD family hydrolase [Candidatus Poribacteria bacterium]MYH80233.1 HAD family hydrolase [Candidatus Poribacteria bacterium]MYK96798.1 HAD family hydrolase [Candidatus Poribacteria bacterium]